MGYTLEECERLWDEAGRYGTPRERVERARRWLPYYAYIAEGQRTVPFRPEQDEDGFAAQLFRGGMLTSEDSVLDIGAGMGGYALELARRCRTVTALELSEPCIDVLRTRADACGIGNISCICGSWEDDMPEEKFDVAFSSLCPAICNVEELRRMESIAKRRCVLITVMRGSYDKHRRAMMSELGIRPQSMVTEAIHYYNTLYQMGRLPEVRCRTSFHTYDVPAEAIMAQYPVYFDIFGIGREKSIPYLEGYLKEHADHGVLHDESRINLAMLTWEVPQ